MSSLNDMDARLDYERGTRAPTDIDLEPITAEDEDYESAPPDYEISTYPADFTLEVLYQKWKAEEILIPEFQRRFVWKQVQASKLIESFLVGLPVPAVFLYSERKSQKYFVIDGQQRLKSVVYFFEGFFGPEIKGQRKVFRLTGLSPESPFANKDYEHLREEDQRRLKNAVLRAFIVQQLDPNDDTSMYHIFERLNTGGTLLTNQEIRNCVYHGELINLLDELNRDPSWRQILGKEPPDTRRKDVELIVRFFALQDISKYKKPMKDWLSKFMRKNHAPTNEQLDRTRATFSTTCRRVVDALGPTPFHVRTGLNAAVFDAVMVAFNKHGDQIPEDIRERYQQLIADQAFERDTKSATTDADAVRGRQQRAVEILFGS